MGGTPSSYPFLHDIFHDILHPAMGLPPRRVIQEPGCWAIAGDIGRPGDAETDAETSGFLGTLTKKVWGLDHGHARFFFWDFTNELKEEEFFLVW